jgi:predicted metal-dependent hydrolase
VKRVSFNKLTKNSSGTFITGIGHVLLERSDRARCVIITVKSDQTIRVAVPARVTFKTALEFVHQKKSWIKKALTRIHQKEAHQRDLAALFAGIDKSKAKSTLTARLQALAKKHGLSYNKVFIRNQRTRWGSCSTKGNISLNMKLVVLPQELIDYVLLHELVHTKIHNHSRRFWGGLDKHVGNAKSLSARLKQYDLQLM